MFWKGTTISVLAVCGLNCAYVSILVQSSCSFQANPTIIHHVGSGCRRVQLRFADSVLGLSTSHFNLLICSYHSKLLVGVDTTFEVKRVGWPFRSFLLGHITFGHTDMNTPALWSWKLSSSRLFNACLGYYLKVQSFVGVNQSHRTPDHRNWNLCWKTPFVPTYQLHWWRCIKNIYIVEDMIKCWIFTTLFI